MSSIPAGPMLALDSSTRGGSVALAVDGERVAERILPETQGASSTLLPAADALMREHGLTPAALRAVVVGGGPGSFTGLRIAASTAKGIVRALGIPLFAYSGLTAAAAARRENGERPVCALFDARNREVYAGCWRFRGAVEEVLPVQALGLDAFLDLAGPLAPRFTGEGAWLHADAIRAAAGEDAIATPVGRSIAAGLLWLARVAPELGRVASPAEWEPDYVRASGAERIAAEGRAR